MSIYISILRGINVSGQKKILMADLKKLFEDLKFSNVVTYIQSGNVAFNTNKKQSNAALATQIEKAIAKQYSFEVPVIVRSAEEIAFVLNNNPFLKDAKKNKAILLDKLHVTFLAEIPEQKNIDAISSFVFKSDEFYIINQEVYLYTPGGYGETKLSNIFFESKLKVKATTRNWNTVNKLVELSQN